jgi:hypothetical protein
MVGDEGVSGNVRVSELHCQPYCQVELTAACNVGLADGTLRRPEDRAGVPREGYTVLTPYPAVISRAAPLTTALPA